MPSSRAKRAYALWRQYRGLAAILVMFIALGLVYSMVTPIFEASDELWHFPFVKRLADGQGLPVQRPGQIGPWRQEGTQPPLYYALGALLIKGLDTSDMDAVRWINPHADIGVPTLDRNVNMVIHTERERHTWRGTVLAVRLVRWMSLLMGAVSVWAGYMLAQQVFPEDKLTALTTACLTAFNAMFLFITASVNNDALVIMLCSVCLWLMVRYVASRPTVAQWTLLGVLMALACLAKVSALGLLPLAALSGLIVAWRARSWKALLTAGLATGLPVILLAGWWYYRNWRLYRDPLALSVFVEIVGGRYPVPTLRQLLGEWKGFVMSYWGFFGGVNVPAPDWVYILLSAFGVLGLVATPLSLWRWQKAKRLDLVRWLQLGLIALWIAIEFVALIRWTRMTIASQGRLMFAALTAISFWMSLGLAGILSGRWRALLPGAAILAMLLIAWLLPFTTIQPAYAPPQKLTEGDLSNIQTRLDVTFDGKMRLLGYTLEQERATPGEQIAVTLYWQALQTMRENYSVFVHLLGANDLIIGQRDMYPGQGTYATTLWRPGEIIADRYVVPVSPTALTPGEIEIEVGLYRLETGTRLAVTDSSGVSRGDNVRFGRIALPLRIQDGIPNPIYVNFEDRIALVGYALQPTAAAPGSSFYLSLYWRALRDIHVNYSVFTHVLGEQHRIWAQMDSWPQGGNAPTATWRKGQLIEDAYELKVAQDAPMGIYDLQVGLYAADGKRLSVLGQGGHVIDTRIVLSKVRILPAQ